MLVPAAAAAAGAWVALLCVLLAAAPAAQAGVEVTLLHYNDVHHRCGC